MLPRSVAPPSVVVGESWVRWAKICGGYGDVFSFPAPLGGFDRITDYLVATSTGGSMVE